MANAPDLPQLSDSLQGWLVAARDEDASVRAEAMAVGAKLGAAAKQATPALIAALKDENCLVRTKAVASLASLLGQVQTAALAIHAALKEAAHRDGDEIVRAAAVQALVQLGPLAQAPVPSLIESLRDEWADVRLGAVAALAEIGPTARQAVAALIQSLRDPDPRVRIQSAAALWRIDHRDRITVPMMREFLKDPDQGLRWIAADCLREIGPLAADAYPSLLKALAQETRSPLVRKAILLALQRIDPETTALLGID